MSTLTLSSQLSAVPELKFSDSRAAGLFVEALHLLRRYEQTSSKHFLETAQTVLEESLKISPRELLPKFYLGITKSVLGDLDQREPIHIFREFSESDIFPLKAAAQYNLAAAYVETYNRKRYPEAIRILKTLLRELKLKGVPLGQHNSVRRLLEYFGDRRIRIEQLFYQSLETRDYMWIHLHIWDSRWTSHADKISAKADRVIERLKAREAGLKKHERFLGSQRGEIWAWHWNNMGMIEESRAAIARRTNVDPEPAAREAEKCFDAARKSDPSFESSRGNLARLYFEIRGNFQKAIQLFEQVALGAEDTVYAHFSLGQLYTIEQDREKAIYHFKFSKHIKDWGIDADDWVAVRRSVADDLETCWRIDTALLLLGKLLLENPLDTKLRGKIKHLQELEQQRTLSLS